MSTIPSHYKLVQEGPHSYEIHDARDGRNFHIAKQGLDLQMHGKLSKIKHFQTGGEVKHEDDFDYMLNELGGDTKSRQEGYAKEQESLPKTLAEAEQVETPIPLEAQAQMPQAPSEEAIQVPQVAPINDFQKNQIQKTSALEDQRAKLEAGAKAEAEQGENTAKAYENYVKDSKKLKTPLQIYGQYKEQNDRLRKAYENKEIDPEHYWESKNTGSKITALLGMALGGIGARDGGPNYALENIQKSIDRDIKAQMENRSAKMNLYKMNLEASHDEQQAYRDTQTQMLLGVQAQALQFAAKAMGPMAQARIAPIISALDAQIAQNTLNKAIFSSSAQGNKIGADPSLLVQSLIPKEHQAAAFKEIETMKNMKEAKAGLLKAYNEINQMWGKGVMSPSRRKSLIDTKVGPLVKASEGQFTEKQAEAFLDGFFPRTFESQATSDDKGPLIDEFFNARKSGSVFKQTGLDLDQFQSTALPNSPKTDFREKAVNYIRSNASNKDPMVQKRIQFLKQKLGK